MPGPKIRLTPCTTRQMHPLDADIRRVGLAWPVSRRDWADLRLAGQGDASQAAVQISTFARGSAIAAANHRSFQGARAIRIKRGQPLSVRVMPGDGQDTLALVDIGDSSVLIRSNLPSANRPNAGTAQILALLSRLAGSLHKAKASSFPSRVASTAVRARTASAKRVRYEYITHRGWLFTGSMYDQSSGRPNSHKRLDPVSVIWKGGGQATVQKVRTDTYDYWKASAIPHGYPGGDQMKPRDTDPLCRDGHGVFFRSRSTRPNAGKWEQSDPRGFMSTNGFCANQYHLRMWSSKVLHDLTGAHLREFVLAPIHHDHVYFKFKCYWVGIERVCTPSIKHGRPDLSFDKARYAYARIMSHKLCVFNHWRVNPESEHKDYQKYTYSGWVSRITFWHLTRHRKCHGV